MVLHPTDRILVGLFLFSAYSITFTNAATTTSIPDSRKLQQHVQDGVITDELQIKFHKGTSDSDLHEFVERIQTDTGCKRGARIFRPSEKHEEAHRAAGLHLWVSFQCHEAAPVAQNQPNNNNAAQGAGVEAAIGVIRKQLEQGELPAGMEMDHVQAGFVVEMTNVMDAKSVPRSATTFSTSTSNDPRLSQQTHYDTIKLYEAWAFMDANNAWPEASLTTVHVLDSGWDLSHQDSGGNKWVNPGEDCSPGASGNGIDDDGNGFIDDCYGYNHADNTGTDLLGSGDHGSHCSGTISADTDNNLGVAGVAGGLHGHHGASIMTSVGFGVSDTSGFAEALVYAADHGAHISSNSWGYRSANYYEQSVLDAIDYADNSGTLVVFAAGNDGSNAPRYPAYYSKVVAVAATDDNKRAAWFTNYGFADIAAPGVDVLSTGFANNYVRKSGTSMSCPHIAGVLALGKTLSPALNSTELRDCLYSTAENIDAYQTDSRFQNGGLGAGMVDTHAFLVCVKDKTGTAAPTHSMAPSEFPSLVPSSFPTESDPPTIVPTAPPTGAPTSSRRPTGTPTVPPTNAPSATIAPSAAPTERKCPVRRAFVPLVEGEPGVSRLVLYDDTTAAVNLLFDFPWMGNERTFVAGTQIRVSSNGQINMDGSYGSNCCSAEPVDGVGIPRIALAQEDLNPSSGGKVLVKSSPLSLTVSFQDVPFYGYAGSTFANVQAELFPAGYINICFGEGANAGSYMATGVEDPDLGFAFPATDASFGYSNQGITRTWPAGYCYCFDPATVPTRFPSNKPSEPPSAQPTLSAKPSSSPSTTPTSTPTMSQVPSLPPSHFPTGEPTISSMPSSSPTHSPTNKPSLSMMPSSAPVASLCDLHKSFQPLALGQDGVLQIAFGDDAVTGIMLPFDFLWMGLQTKYAGSQIWVSSNGQINLGSAYDSGCCDADPVDGNGIARIALAQEDLDPSTGGQVLARFSAGSLTVSFQRVPFWGYSGTSVNVQAVLYPDGVVSICFGQGENSFLSFATGMEDPYYGSFPARGGDYSRGISDEWPAEGYCHCHDPSWDPPSSSPTPRATAYPTVKPSAFPSSSAFPSGQPSASPTDQPNAPTWSPTMEPATPTSQPASQPTRLPTSLPTSSPSNHPTPSPTRQPTRHPTPSPTRQPTRQPTPSPTRQPTSPTRQPTTSPTTSPTNQPTSSPTNQPTSSPTNQPTSSPTYQPNPAPTSPTNPSPVDPTPTSQPNLSPTSQPNNDPTAPTVNRELVVMGGQQQQNHQHTNNLRNNAVWDWEQDLEEPPLLPATVEVAPPASSGSRTFGQAMFWCFVWNGIIASLFLIR